VTVFFFVDIGISNNGFAMRRWLRYV